MDVNLLLYLAVTMILRKAEEADIHLISCELHNTTKEIEVMSCNMPLFPRHVTQTFCSFTVTQNCGSFQPSDL